MYKDPLLCGCIRCVCFPSAAAKQFGKCHLWKILFAMSFHSVLVESIFRYSSFSTPYMVWKQCCTITILKQWYCTITNSKLVITNSKLVSKTSTTFSSCQKAQSYCQFFLHGYWITYLFFDFWHTAWLSWLTPKRKIKIKIKRKTIYWEISSYTHTFNFYIDSDTIKQFLGGTGEARNLDFFSAGRFWPGS